MLLRLLVLEPGSSREALEGIPESPLRAMVTCSADREVLSNLLRASPILLLGGSGDKGKEEEGLR